MNRKIYVGVHKTKSLDDGYMGSGKMIKSAIEKYGIDNFTKDILEFFENQELMYAREKEIVTEEFLLEDHVYNLNTGGYGGWHRANNLLTPEDRTVLGNKGGFVNKHKWSEEIKIRAKNGWKKGGKKSILKLNEFHRNNFKNNKNYYKNLTINATIKSHTIEANQKRKDTFLKIEHQLGSKNSQFGSRWAWINKDGEKAIKIKLSLLDEYLKQGYKRGRK